MRLLNFESFNESLKQGREYVKAGKLDKSILDHIESITNDDTKKYIGWLSKQYINEPYDIDKMKSYIEEYLVLSNRKMINSDINRFKKIDDFISEIDKVNSSKSASNKELETDYDVLVDNKDILIIRPNTYEASR